MVDEEALGLYISRSSSAFLPNITPQMFMLTVRSSVTNIVQSQEMRTSSNNALVYKSKTDLQKHSIKRRSNENVYNIWSSFGI